MIFGYDAAQTFLHKRGLLVAIGVVALPLSFQLHGGSRAGTQRLKQQTGSDPRVAAVHGFLTRLRCPVASLSEDFVRVADQNNLDWRLLPSIAVVESGGGKQYRHNNIFGWNRGNQEFPSIKSGLELVAYKLGRSKLYRRSDSLGKLRIYNENQDYASSVVQLMNRISPLASLN